MTSILVVDDSAVDRCLVSELLKKEPAWTVEIAEHGLAAFGENRASRCPTSC